MAEHKDLTGADLHEPKGIATASDGQSYMADGLGSGSWVYTGDTVHGEMTVISNTTAETVATASDPTLNTDSDYTQIITGWSAGHVDGGITFSTDKVVVPYAGEYEIAAWANIICPANNQKVAIKYAINTTTPLSSRKLVGTSAAAGDYVNVSGHGVVTLAISDTVSLYIATDKAGNPTVTEAGLFIKLLEAV
jgi:hypothetical protein